MHKVSINGLKCFGFHGCLPEEQSIGGHYSVNVVAFLDLSKAGVSDNLEHTVDYVWVSNMVKSVMSVPSKLIEKAALNMCQQLKDHYDKVDRVEVTIFKLHPPMSHEVESVSVTVSL